MNFDNAFNRVADFTTRLLNLYPSSVQSFGRGFNSAEELWETVQK